MKGFDFVLEAALPDRMHRMDPGRLQVSWRREGEARWRDVALQRRQDGLFSASSPAGPASGTIETFISATDGTYRAETAPSTAPAASYRFTPTPR